MFLRLIQISPEARFFQTHQRPQERALPGPGASQDHERFAVLHLKRDAVQNLDLAITHAQVAQRDHDLCTERICVFRYHGQGCAS